jgi:hypothetical protein
MTKSALWSIVALISVFPRILLGQEIAVNIPVAPTAFRGGGKTHLVYELRITNSGAAEAHVKEIEVLGNGVLASFAGRDLNSMMPTGRIPSGASGVAFMWVTLQNSPAIPAKIRHRVIFDNKHFEGAEVPVGTEPVPVLGPPLRGEGWQWSGESIRTSPSLIYVRR